MPGLTAIDLLKKKAAAPARLPYALGPVAMRPGIAPILGNISDILAAEQLRNNTTAAVSIAHGNVVATANNLKQAAARASAPKASPEAKADVATAASEHMTAVQALNTAQINRENAVKAHLNLLWQNYVTQHGNLQTQKNIAENQLSQGITELRAARQLLNNLIGYYRRAQNDHNRYAMAQTEPKIKTARSEVARLLRNVEFLESQHATTAANLSDSEALGSTINRQRVKHKMVDHPRELRRAEERAAAEKFLRYPLGSRFQRA